VTAGLHSEAAAVRWLTVQAAVFGIVAALLGIVANALFLDAFGSSWLPVTYIAIGFAGLVLSGGVARSAESVDVIRLAVAVLGGAGIAFGGAWLVAIRGGGAWVSVPLLVLFPVLIQLGFVFIGGQAGRLLDIAGIKARFPRITAGFPVGAVVGGILGGQLVALSGRTEDLLLATAGAELIFVGLVWATGRRFPSQLRASAPRGAIADRVSDTVDSPAPSWRRRFGEPFVALILVYQVLSALGSQLADFLVLDRAVAAFPEPEDLARFLSGYTAVMNVVSIAFLALLAGPLLRRFGLRLGIVSNPLVLTVLAIGMVGAYGLVGPGSVAMLAVVSAARIADIALTDGTTRTSINATYQVLPESVRLPVQATVEGIGVPLAIAMSGVVIIALDVLPEPLGATIVVTTVVCGVWTWTAFRLYRAYGPALVDALRTRPILDTAAEIEAASGDEEVARELLLRGDVATQRLSLGVAAAIPSAALTVELAALVDDPDPDVRIAALAALTARGDEPARRRLAEAVRAYASSRETGARLRAAVALQVLDHDDRAIAASLLTDDEAEVRSAALEALQPGDAFAAEATIAALADPRTLGPAAGAVERLGDATVPMATALLESGASPVPPVTLRLVRAAPPTPAWHELLRRHVTHPDRDLGLLVIEALIAAGPAPEPTAQAVDDVLADDARHAVRILAAQQAIESNDSTRAEADAPLRRALADELDLIGQRVVAGRLARHGRDAIGPAVAGLAVVGPQQALAVEAVQVVLEPGEASLARALIHPDLTAEARLEQLTASAVVPSRDVVDCLRDIAEDAGGEWRSPWLRACALHAARGRNALDDFDLAPARALGDPIVDEVLAGTRP
jgi:hypothetical protein